MKIKLSKNQINLMAAIYYRGYGFGIYSWFPHQGTVKALMSHHLIRVGSQSTLDLTCLGYDIICRYFTDKGHSL